MYKLLYTLLASMLLIQGAAVAQTPQQALKT